ncbi:MAG: hypothetical protein ACYS6K_24055 [Planctomycetota bacterium]|jgi:hypothetical protein
MSELAKAQIVLLVFFVTAAIMTPPDVVSQIALVVVMVIIYGLLIFIVSRFKSYAQTPQSIKNLILVLVCLLTITISFSIISFEYRRNYRRLRAEHSKCPTSQEQTQTESQ